LLPIRRSEYRATSRDQTSRDQRERLQKESSKFIDCALDRDQPCLHQAIEEVVS
jgi:hypothetical protein